MESQPDVVLILIGAAWVAIGGMLVWGTVSMWYRFCTGPRALPFFEVIARQGLNARQVEAAAGAGGLARALRRCALCVSREECGRAGVHCPNEALVRHVSRLGRR